MQISSVIFDMDGLMLDTEPIYKIAWQQAAVECRHAISEALYFELIGRTRIAGEEILREALGPRFSPQVFRVACRKREAAAFAGQLPAKKPGLDDLLAFLEQRRIPKAVATSTERPEAEVMLREHNLRDCFNVLATGDEVPNGKPSPDLFLLAARRLGISPSECLVLEDSEAGIVAANRAGMQVYIIPDLRPPSTSVESLAQGRFDSLASVEKELRRQSSL
jgi:HAD superfamily hydrolase (TIGR01509 family)